MKNLLLVDSVMDLGGGLRDGWGTYPDGRLYALYDGPPNGSGQTYLYRRICDPYKLWTLRRYLASECELEAKRLQTEAYLRWYAEKGYLGGEEIPEHLLD